MRPLPIPTAFGLAALGGLSAVALAGGSPENAVLIVDPTNAESMRVANHYRKQRDVPDANVIFLAPTTATYQQFSGATLDAFLGALGQLGIADHADYVILPSGGSFYTQANGLLSDSCSPVHRFSATAPFALANQKAQILAGSDTTTPNGYYRGQDDARAFDSSIGWASGVPNASGQRYFIAAMLGYTGPLGNTLPEVLAMIDRSVAVDGTRPPGTYFFMQTTDFARSSPRHGFYPGAVASIAGFGGSAQHLFADLPIGQMSCLGIMTGLAAPDVDNASLGLVPGSFADHLTSYAATFDTSSQTKMSRWIAKGASGTSGAVEEPCNYPGKFPHARLHVFYQQGLSLGEAWFRSLGYAPFQTLFVGDPLTRPFAYLPSVSLPGAPTSPVSGTIALAPSATTAHPTAQITGFELLVDGRSRSTCGPAGHFALETTTLADGWHEMRVLAWDYTLVKSTGRWIGSLQVDNHGRSASLGAVNSSGDLTTRFDFNASAAGASVQEMRLVQGSRVVAATSSSPATLSVFGRNLGAGAVRLQLEAQFTDGLLARSAPVEVSIAATAGTPSGALPVAHGYTKGVLASQAAIVELPTSFDDDLASASWTLLSNPTQAAVIGGSGPYRIVKPNAGASGADSMTFRVTTPSGQSSVATVTLAYDNPFTCPQPTNFCVSAPNSASSGAVMGFAGTTSIGANDFQLYAYFCPPDKAGIFLYSSNATQVPLGNGWRCVDNPIFRLGVVMTDSFGDAFKAIDFTQTPMNAGPGAITSGATKRFQFWFRDPPGGGALTNLTDGLSATFCP